MKTFTAILQREDDMYVAKCPEIGTVSQGATIEGSSGVGEKALGM